MINTDIILILTSIVGLISLVWIVHSLPMWGKFHDNGVGREGQFGQGGHIEHEHDIEEDKDEDDDEGEDLANPHEARRLLQGDLPANANAAAFGASKSAIRKMVKSKMKAERRAYIDHVEDIKKEKNDRRRDERLDREERFEEVNEEEERHLIRNRLRDTCWRRSIRGNGHGYSKHNDALNESSLRQQLQLVIKKQIESGGDQQNSLHNACIQLSCTPLQLSLVTESPI